MLFLTQIEALNCYFRPSIKAGIAPSSWHQLAFYTWYRFVQPKLPEYHHQMLQQYLYHLTISGIETYFIAI